MQIQTRRRHADPDARSRSVQLARRQPITSTSCGTATAIGVWAPDETLTTKKGMLSNHAHLKDAYYDGVRASIAANAVANSDAYFKTM
jgi:hypothetical protein